MTTFSPKWVGKRAHPLLDFSAGLENPPLLGDVGSIGNHIREQLEPGDHVRQERFGESAGQLEHAVNPVEDLQACGGRQQVDVAGVDERGLAEEQVHHFNDIARAGDVERRQAAQRRHDGLLLHERPRGGGPTNRRSGERRRRWRPAYPNVRRPGCQGRVPPTVMVVTFAPERRAVLATIPPSVRYNANAGAYARRTPVHSKAEPCCRSGDRIGSDFIILK